MGRDLFFVGFIVRGLGWGVQRKLTAIDSKHLIVILSVSEESVTLGCEIVASPRLATKVLRFPRFHSFGKHLTNILHIVTGKYGLRCTICTD